MNPDEREVLEAFASAALAPATGLIDNVIGVLGGDQLAEFRERQKAKRAQRHSALGMTALKILQSRGVMEPIEPNAGAVDELARAAEEEPREELRDLWARLLAAMFDPQRAPGFRREFIEIAKQLEPLDAAVLSRLGQELPPGRDRRTHVAEQLGTSTDDVECSCLNLIRLGLGSKHPSNYQMASYEPTPTALGRRFLATVE